MSDIKSSEVSKTDEVSKSTLDYLLADLSPEQENCKGMVFKADVQHCRTERGVLFSVRLNKMKRMSCPGCINCGGTEDSLSEIDPEIWSILDIEKCKHGKLYTLEYCNIRTDWETGYVDSFDLRAVEYSG